LKKKENQLEVGQHNLKKVKRYQEVTLRDLMIQVKLLKQQRQLKLNNHMDQIKQQEQLKPINQQDQVEAQELKLEVVEAVEETV
jgi:hypothetical protein